jgi:RNA polymerase sigma factor (sigma-70 family)
MAAHCGDDAVLVTAWKRGDQAAGAELFRRYYGAVLRFYQSKVGPQGTDLVQRCFLRCLEVRARIRDESSFRCFLFGVARNVLLEHYRSMRAGGRVDFTEQTVEDLSPTPTSELAQGERSQQLLLALRRLPVEQQIVVELYYWEDLNAREIAEIYEVPEPTVRTRLRRAKIRLEQELHALAGSPEVVVETMTNLDTWARRLRDQIGGPAEGR